MFPNRYVAFVVTVVSGIILLVLYVVGLPFGYSVFFAVAAAALIAGYFVTINNAAGQNIPSEWQLGVPVDYMFGVTEKGVDKIRSFLIEPDENPRYKDQAVEDHIVLVARHHMLYIFDVTGAAALAFLAVGFAILTFYFTLSDYYHKSSPAIILIALASFGCAIIAFGFGYIQWRTRYIVATKLRVWRVNVYPMLLAFVPAPQRAFDYSSIGEIDYDEPLWGKLFKYGTVILNSPANTTAEDDDDFRRIKFMIDHRRITSLIQRENTAQD